MQFEPFVRHIVLTMAVPAFGNLVIVTVGAAVQQTPCAPIGMLMYPDCEMQSRATKTVAACLTMKCEEVFLSPLG